MNYDYKNNNNTSRNKLILAQEEFAKLLGVSFASVNRWEMGHHEPTIKLKRKIVVLCKKHKIRIDEYTDRGE